MVGVAFICCTIINKFYFIKNYYTKTKEAELYYLPRCALGFCLILLERPRPTD